MFQAWSIADGPAQLTDQDVNAKHTVSVTTDNGESTSAHLLFETVGQTIAGDTRPFSGTLFFGQVAYSVIGTYNHRICTGHCQTTTVA